MKFVYVVTYGYEYEGERLHAVWRTLRQARLSRPQNGDSQHIYRVMLDSGAKKEMPWVPKQKAKDHS